MYNNNVFNKHVLQKNLETQKKLIVATKVFKIFAYLLKSR